MTPKNIQILTAMSELGAGTRGASLGWQALVTASLNKYPTLFYKRNIKAIPHENELLMRPEKEAVPHHIDGIARQYQRMEREIAAVLRQGHFPLVITGDHSNAGGTIAGVKKAHPQKRLGVVWIDAHADLHSPYTSPSGNVHGMPLATALQEDNRQDAEKESTSAEIEHWNTMKGNEQRLQPQDLFFVGLRDTEAPEDNLRKRHNMPNVTVEELRQKGAPAVAKQALDYLQQCDILYVSFDVDSLDSGISVGTGTPVPNGLQASEARELLLHLATDERLAALEVTEINPCLDTKGNAMAETALDILKPVIEKLEE